jgi:PAS domain S-box-containing protein
MDPIFRRNVDEMEPLIALLHSMARVTWRSDVQGQVKQLVGWCEYTGRSMEDTLGSGWIQDVHPEDLPATAAEVERATREQDTYRTEYRMRGADGNFRWFEVYGVPVLDDTGQVCEWIGVCLDIHDRVQTERRLQRVMDNGSDAYVQIDRDWVVRYINRTSGELTRRDPEAVVGRHIFDVWPVPEGADFERQYRLALTEQRPVRFVHAWGGLLLDIHAVPDDEGGLGIFFRDISAQRQLEKHLRRAQRMEALGHLAGGVAHDFNNILGLFLAHADQIAELVEEHGGVEGVEEEIEGIIEATHRASEINRQILEFARRQDSDPLVVDVNDCVRDVDRLARGVIGKEVSYDASLSNDVGCVLIDPAQFNQLILNLVSNAAQAMGGTGRVTVATGRVTLDREEAGVRGLANGGSYATIRVTDSGPGIPAEIRDKIFDPFFTTKQDRGGTGLGLATCYGIVTGAGGMIDVESTEGEGATFAVFLPAVDAPASERPARHVSAPEGTETVLLVEDEPRLRRLLHNGLSALGYTVFTAADPNEARRVLGAEAIEIVVTDIVIPGFSGAEFARQVVSDFPGLPVVGMSGYRRGEEMPDSIVPPGLRFLAKPFTPLELGARVRQVLDRTAAGGVRPPSEP